MENLYLELRFEKDPSNLTSSDLKDDVVSKVIERSYFCTINPYITEGYDYS